MPFSFGLRTFEHVVSILEDDVNTCCTEQPQHLKFRMRLT
jgi:hypothetical protein